MTINIKNGIPVNIALTAVLAVVNNAETKGGKTVYAPITRVPVRGATVVVMTVPNRKSECFKVWVDKK